MPTIIMRDRLEYQRLEHRARRMEMVLSALEDRAIHRHDGDAPAPLRHAIRDFRLELVSLRRRMRALRDAGRRR